MHKRIGYLSRKKVLRNANFLDLTPVRQHHHELDDNGMVTIMVPKFNGWLSSRILQPLVRHPYISISLDELGSSAWLLCDGNTSVREICRQLVQQFDHQIHPAEERVTTFLSGLYRDSLVIFKEVMRRPG